MPLGPAINCVDPDITQAIFFGLGLTARSVPTKPRPLSSVSARSSTLKATSTPRRRLALPPCRTFVVAHAPFEASTRLKTASALTTQRATTQPSCQVHQSGHAVHICNLLGTLPPDDAKEQLDAAINCMCGKKSLDIVSSNKAVVAATPESRNRVRHPKTWLKVVDPHRRSTSRSLTTSQAASSRASTLGRPTACQ